MCIEYFFFGIAASIFFALLGAMSWEVFKHLVVVALVSECERWYNVRSEVRESIGLK